MTRAPLGLALVLLVASAGACGDDDDDDDGGAMSARGYDAISYDLTARFDWETRRFHVTEEITVRLVEGNRRVDLDAEVDVARVHAGGAELPFTREGTELRVDVSSLEGETVTFTVDFETGPSAAMFAGASRDGDPVTSRVVYTQSEPDYGRLWLVGNHRPADRALFSFEMTVAADEDVISNGTRVRDESTVEGRVVGYALDAPIPTYIMAFAAGQLVKHERTGGMVPLALWHRRGLVVDVDANFDMLAEQMAVFEDLLGPYPWDTYAVVLLPLFGGGMENASITFNDELTGQGTPSFNLNAHELAHQWFGDWVTVASFEDLWIKEGMATLLASEASRGTRDLEGRGRLFGIDFAFAPDDAIRDPLLTDRQRYTSGPYTRAASLLTQIRAREGDDAFWAAARKVLEDHALGSIDGETFLAALGASDAEVAVEAKGSPELTLVAEGSGLRLSLADPAHTLLVPLGVTVVDGAGAATTSMLAAGGSITVEDRAGGYLALDEGDVHALGSFAYQGYDRWRERRLATEAAAVAAFATRSPSVQEQVLLDEGAPFFPAGELPAFYASLDSTSARRYAEISACRALRAGIGGWDAVIGPILQMPAVTSFSTSFSACGPTVATTLFGAELVTAAAATDGPSATRLQYLMSFDYGAATFETIARVARQGSQLELRDLALTRLGAQAAPGFGYTAVPGEQTETWKAFFREQLAGATSGTRYLAVWRGIRGLRDETALAAAGARMRQVPLSAGNQRAVICEARVFASQQAFASFGAALQPWGDLSEPARLALESAAGCD